MFLSRRNYIKFKSYWIMIMLFTLLFCPVRGWTAERVIEKVNGEPITAMMDYEGDDTIRITGARLAEEDWAELRKMIFAGFHLILDNGQDEIPAKALSTNGVVPSAVMTITAPDVISVGDDAFSNNSFLTFINLPSLRSIGEMAFFSCPSLSEIELPKYLDSIGDGAFAMCRGLVSINVAEGNERFKSLNGVLYSADGNTLYAFPPGSSQQFVTTGAADIRPFSFYGAENLKSVLFSAAETIGNGAFVSCLKLADIKLAEGLKSIGNGAFDSCQSLSVVELPVSLETIGDGAFSYCSSLNSISIAQESERFQSIDGVLYSLDGKTIHAYPAGKEDSCYSSKAEEIKPYAFMYAMRLRTVTLPNAVSIGEGAFAWCENLTAAFLPSAEVFDIGAFAWCYSLKLMVLGKAAPAINKETFIPDDNSILIASSEAEGDFDLSSWPVGVKFAALHGTATLGPVILKQEDKLTLSLEIEGASEYRWNKNGVPVDGISGASYKKPNVVEDDNGIYGVTFKYDMGSGPVDIEIKGISVVVQ